MLSGNSQQHLAQQIDRFAVLLGFVVGPQQGLIPALVGFFGQRDGLAQGFDRLAVLLQLQMGAAQQQIGVRRWRLDLLEPALELLDGRAEPFRRHVELGQVVTRPLLRLRRQGREVDAALQIGDGGGIVVPFYLCMGQGCSTTACS